MRSTHLFSCLALLCALSAGGEGAGKHHTDKRWGYKVRVPSGWITAALSADEEWIASKHFAKRELQAKKQIWWAVSRPEMWVVGFPQVRLKERGARRTKDAKGNTEIVFKNPYKDYPDFVKREKSLVGDATLFSGPGGYHFSKEEEITVAKMKVTHYEIKFDKLADAPLRIVTYVFHFDDVDFAVQFKVLEDYYRQYKSTIRACLRSFRRVERSKALPGTTTTGSKKVFDDVDEDKLTKEERAKHRRDKVEQQYQREISVLPRGWHHFRTDHYLVLSNASKRYGKDIVRHAEAIRRYLDATFGNLGVDQVPPAIIRIFKTYPERSAYTEGTRRFWGGVDQVLVVEGDSATSLNWDITDQWLDFKNKDLVWNMPDWIQTGLRQHMSFARSKGKKVRFVFDAWDRSDLRTLLKKEEAMPLKALISGRYDEEREKEFSGGEIEIDWEKMSKMSRQSTQAGSVVTYLLTRGNRGKVKGALAGYLKHLILAITKAEAAYKKDTKKIQDESEAKRRKKLDDAADRGDDEDADEDEEEEMDEEAAKEMTRKWREAMSKKKKSIRDQAFQASFGHLTDKDWRRLDGNWRRFVKSK